MNKLTGDLWLQSGWKVVPINQDGVFGAGIAQQFGEKYPQYLPRYCFSFRILFDVHVILLPVKVHWQEKARLDLIRLGLERLITWSQENREPRINVPLLRCGYGRLERKIVEPLITDYLTASNFWLILPPDDITERYPHSVV